MNYTSVKIPHIHTTLFLQISFSLFLNSLFIDGHGITALEEDYLQIKSKSPPFDFKSGEKKSSFPLRTGADTEDTVIL